MPNGAVACCSYIVLVAFAAAAVLLAANVVAVADVAVVGCRFY